MSKNTKKHVITTHEEIERSAIGRLDEATLCSHGHGRVTVIHRPDSLAAPNGARVAENGLGSIKVFSGPFHRPEALRAVGLPATPAVYMLVGERNGSLEVYVGETGNARQRHADHLKDPAKRHFATFYAVTWPSLMQSKEFARYRQARYAALIAEASRARLVGAPPEPVNLSEAMSAMTEAAIEEERHLLWDIGFNLLEPHRRPPSGEVRIPHEKGASTVDPAAPTMQFAHCGLWAWGLQCDDRFIVLPGSEFRLVGKSNPGVENIVRRRQALLQERRLLAPIPGVKDRRRLTVAVGFWTASIAARVIAGSHVHSAAWRPVDRDGGLVIID